MAPRWRATPAVRAPAASQRAPRRSASRWGLNNAARPEAQGQRGLQRRAMPSRPGAQPVVRTGWGGAGRRPGAAFCQVPAQSSAPIAHHVDKIRRTKTGGLRWTTVDGQKWSGRRRRRGHRPIGFSITWVSSRSPVGNGLVAGVRDGTWRRRRFWPRKRRGAAMSVCRGTCRSSKLRIGAPRRKVPARRTRESGMLFAGVGHTRTGAGKHIDSRHAGGARGRRSRANSVCPTPARATWQCGWRSATRCAQRCRGHCEDVTEGDTDNEQVDLG